MDFKKGEVVLVCGFIWCLMMFEWKLISNHWRKKNQENYLQVLQNKFHLILNVVLRFLRIDRRSFKFIMSHSLLLQRGFTTGELAPPTMRQFNLFPCSDSLE